MPEISVVIPVYNVEKYLKQCLDSVVNQTFNDIEIICIDDGSSDSSLDILNEYAKKDDRFKILTQENKGPSYTRNRGIDTAQGKYLYFMDSDDYIEPESLEELYNIAESNSTDCIIFKMINFDDETGEKYSSEYYDMEFLGELVGDNVFSHKDIKGDLFFVAVSPQGKFFNLDFIRNIKFPEDVIFEDNVFFLEVLLKAERLYFYDKYLCNRRVRSGSLMTSKKNFTDYITVSNMMVDMSKEHGIYNDEYKPQLFEKILKNSFMRFNEVTDESKLEYFDALKKDFLSKKDTLDRDDVFQNMDSRLKEIYYKCMEANTPKEFELYLQLFDLQEKLDKTIEEKTQIKHDQVKLFNRTHDLSSMLNELANENKKLKDKS